MNSARGTYVVVLRAASGIVFQPRGLVISAYPAPLGPVAIAFRERKKDFGFEHKVPIGAAVDVIGEADSLEQAIQTFPVAAAAVTPLVSLCANAAIEDLELDSAYEATPGLTRRQYFQRYLPDRASGRQRPGRPINTAATASFLRRVGGHPDEDRIRRACFQYSMALGNWRRGGEALCLAHLYMGVEAITQAALRRHLALHNKSRADVAREWDCIDSALQVDAHRLAVEARRRLVFSGNIECYAATRAASDGFEHGFMDLQEVNALAGSNRQKAAFYLRTAIVTTAGANPELQPLLDPPFHMPLVSDHTHQELTVFLKGDGKRLAADDELHPTFLWTSRMTGVTRDGPTYRVDIAEEVESKINSAITVEPGTFQIKDPEDDPDHGLRATVKAVR